MGYGRQSPYGRGCYGWEDTLKALVSGGISVFVGTWRTTSHAIKTHIDTLFIRLTNEVTPVVQSASCITVHANETPVISRENRENTWLHSNKP